MIVDKYGDELREGDIVFFEGGEELGTYKIDTLYDQETVLLLKNGYNSVVNGKDVVISDRPFMRPMEYWPIVLILIFIYILWCIFF